MFAILIFSFYEMNTPPTRCPRKHVSLRDEFLFTNGRFSGTSRKNYINELPTTILLYFYFIQKFAYYFPLVEWTRACACAILCYCLFVMLATFAKMCLSISYCSQTLFVLEVYHSQMYTNQNEIFLHFNLKQK